jgi:ribA/ribD-fused uncharacterized protein
MDKDKLYFYSKSADKLAGKGTNECVTSISKYNGLNKIRDWRKILSNFYVAPFVYDGRAYNTVEHAFQGAKISLVSNEQGYKFCLDSEDPIGKGDGLVARKNRKLVLLSDEKLEMWNGMKHEILKCILFAKFSQVEIARKVLLETKDAILLHSIRALPERQYELEEVREMIRSL